MKIKIISRPAGEAPEELRDQWVMLVMNADPLMSVASAVASAHGVRSKGVVTQEEVIAGSENDGGCAILFEDAMKALRAAGKDGAAAQWERLRRGWSPGESHLIFGWQFCEIIEASDEELGMLGLRRCGDC